MSRIVVLALVAALAFACKVEKTGQDTYKVTAPTPQAKKAAEKAKEDAKAAAEKMKQETGEAAQKVGSALQRAGEKVKSETTETASTERSETKKHSRKTTTY